MYPQNYSNRFIFSRSYSKNKNVATFWGHTAYGGVINRPTDESRFMVLPCFSKVLFVCDRPISVSLIVFYILCFMYVMFRPILKSSIFKLQD